MSRASKVRKEDTVYIIAGRDRGKSGRVLQVDRRKQQVLVEGVNLARRAVKANPSKKIKGGVIESEAPLHVSNVAVVCPETNAPTRVGWKRLEDGSKVRVSRQGGIIDKN